MILIIWVFLGVGGGDYINYNKLGKINKGAMVKILVSSKKPLFVMADNQPLYDNNFVYFV